MPHVNYKLRSAIMNSSRLRNKANKTKSRGGDYKKQRNLVVTLNKKSKFEYFSKYDPNKQVKLFWGKLQVLLPLLLFWFFSIFDSTGIDLGDKWKSMKELIIIIIITNLTLYHFWLYSNKFCIAEYIRGQSIASRHFDFSQRFLTVFVSFFN